MIRNIRSALQRREEADDLRENFPKSCADPNIATKTFGAQFVARYARTHVPFTIDELVARLGVTAERALTSLSRLVAAGRLRWPWRLRSVPHPDFIAGGAAARRPECSAAAANFAVDRVFGLHLGARASGGARGPVAGTSSADMNA